MSYSYALSSQHRKSWRLGDLEDDLLQTHKNIITGRGQRAAEQDASSLGCAWLKALDVSLKSRLSMLFGKAKEAFAAEGSAHIITTTCVDSGIRD